MRKVGSRLGTPTGGGVSNESGIEAEDYAASDHQHQLWEAWFVAAPNPPWTGTLQFTKCGNLAMCYLELSNVTSNEPVLSMDGNAQAYKPDGQMDFTGIYFSGTTQAITFRLTVGSNLGPKIEAFYDTAPPAGLWDNVRQAFLIQGHFIYKVYGEKI